MLYHSGFHPPMNIMTRKKGADRIMEQKQYIITTDKKDQGWLDAFNAWSGNSFTMNQKLDPDIVEKVKEQSYHFNNSVWGPAIEIKKINDTNAN